ncbi:MAG: type II toxin-antitoxin system RelE/ParE family toxin [Thermoguttaceae bacterium]|jgi:mRNA interferase RelE/StbE
MTPYEVFFKPSADRQLQKLPPDIQRRIVSELAAVALNPRPPGVVKMGGYENLWRIRIGNYRVLYEIHDDHLIVLVLRIAHRKDAYRG